MTNTLANPTGVSGEVTNKTEESQEDPIESSIGSIGRYQLCIFFLIVLARLPTDYQLTNVVFLIPPVSFTCNDGLNNSTDECPCQDPEYDRSVFESTIVTSWGLICDRAWLASFSQSMYQAGVLFGSLVFSGISDRFGRRIAIVGALFVCPAAVAASALVPTLWMLVALRFLTGAGVGGTMLCTFTLNMELIGKSFRPYMAGLDQTAYLLAFLTIPGIAYRLRDWRHLLLATSVPWIVLAIAIYWIVPESPRWLIAVGKKQEAVYLLKKIASKNSRPIHGIEEMMEQHNHQTEAEDGKRGNFVHLFRTENVRKNTLIMAFVWMMVSFGFYGVNQYFGRLGGNIYLNIFISACLHVPATVVATFAVLKIRRRLTLWLSFGTAAVCLLVLIIVPLNLETTRISIGAVGVIGMYISFVVVYLFSSEIFPTVVRNSALGFASMFARIGGFVAPFVVDIGDEWISLITFGAASFLGAILCYFLPETKGIVLKNHIKEVEVENTKEKDVAKL